MFRRALAVFLVALATPALAEPPKVVTDITPVHGLVSQVMAGVGTPEILISGNANPHDFSLRPSQAQGLSDADLIVWIGDDLTPPIARSIDVLSTKDRSLELLEVPGTFTLEFRDGALFKHDAHNEHDGDAHGHSHDHSHGHQHKGHAHGEVDPHAWLDPENGKLWLTAIAERLSAIDPANAGQYQANATAGKAAIDAAVRSSEAILAPVKDRPFLVFHDAYHYFEHRFGAEAAGAISLADARQPSAARLAEIRSHLVETGAVCVFYEPQFDPSLAKSVAEGVTLRLAVLDPLGSRLPLGADAYPALISSLASDMAGCLDGAV